MKHDNQGALSPTFSMVGAMFIAGFTGLLVKESGDTPINLVFYRCLIGGLIFLIFLHYSKIDKGLKLTPSQWFLCLIGGLALTINWLLLFIAFNYLPVSSVVLVYNFQPFMLILLSYIFLKEHVSYSTIAHLIVAMFGLLLLTDLASPDNLKGVCFALLAALGYAISSLVTRKLKHVSGISLLSVQLVLVSIIMLPFVDVSSSSDINWTYVGLIVLFGTLIQMPLLFHSIQLLSLQKLTVIGFLYPLTSYLLDAYFYEVTFTTTQIIGGGILIAVNLLMSKQREEGNAPKSEVV